MSEQNSNGKSEIRPTERGAEERPQEPLESGMSLSSRKISAGRLIPGHLPALPETPEPFAPKQYPAQERKKIPALAERIFNLLSHPDTVLVAVIAGELLHRPEDRW